MVAKHPLVFIGLDGRRGVCSVCGPVPLYRTLRESPTGLRYFMCSTPRREGSRAYRSRDPERLRRRQRISRLRKQYGLSEEQYNEILESQYGTCAICRASDPGANGTWNVDHDHSCCPGVMTCGRCVRGLLCSNCNTGIGMLREDVTVIQRAAAYLMRAITDGEME